MVMAMIKATEVIVGMNPNEYDFHDPRGSSDPYADRRRRDEMPTR
jgi:hypothetical protein